MVVYHNVCHFAIVKHGVFCHFVDTVNAVFCHFVDNRAATFDWRKSGGVDARRCESIDVDAGAVRLVGRIKV